MKTKKEPDRLTAGQRLAEARIAKNWTLAELGRRAGMSEQSVWRHESGDIPQRAVPSYCQALSVSEEWLVYGIGNGPGDQSYAVVEAYLQSPSAVGIRPAVANMLRRIEYGSLGIRVLGTAEVHAVRTLIEGNLSLQPKMSSDDTAPKHARP